MLIKENLISISKLQKKVPLTLLLLSAVTSRILILPVLTSNSKEGVNKVIELLKFEFLNSMKLAGASNFDDIKKLQKILRFYNESR